MFDDTVKRREKVLNTVISQNGELQKDMKILGELIQKLENDLSVDGQAIESGPEGLKKAADLAEVLTIVKLSFR